jgi:hypothetical protein
MPRNGHEPVREDLMHELRRKVRQLAGEGLQPVEIWDRLTDQYAETGSLNETERELLTRVVQSEVEGATEGESRATGSRGDSRA